MIRFTGYGTLALVAAAAVACGQAPAHSNAPTASPGTAAPMASATTTAAPEAPPKEEAWKDPEPGSLLEQLMKSHFTETVTIRSSVIGGKIDPAIEPARSLVNLEGVDTLPDLWQASVTELQAAAQRIAQSPDLPEAAAATSDIGRACGRCHKEVGGGPKLKVGSLPPDDGSTTARMKRHLWAAERLWEGVFVPSDDAWKAGVKALELDPFAKKMLEPGGVHAKSLAERFMATGKKAAAVTDPKERGVIYGTLLSTCAPCHEQLNVDINKKPKK